MRIPDWTPERKPQPQDLVQAVLARRGGTLLNLDRALLWSEPLARGWNTYLGAVRTGLGASRQLRELGICTVALITGARYEYHHHGPDYVAAGGTQAALDALQAWVGAGAQGEPAGLAGDEALVACYAAQMTRDVKHLIQDNTDIPALTAMAYKAGMRPLRVAGATKVALGMTTFEEVLKVAPLQ